MYSVLGEVLDLELYLLLLCQMLDFNKLRRENALNKITWNDPEFLIGSVVSEILTDKQKPYANFI